MGIYDYIRGGKKEKKQMPEGEKVSAKSPETFKALCESLAKDFKGVMRLYSKTAGRLYNAAMLLEDGNITGASFEDIDFKRVYHKEDAVSRIRDKLSGTAGDLALYSFSQTDVENVKKTNREVMLKTPVPFSSLEMRIKLNLSGQGGASGPGQSVGGLHVREIEVGSGFNLADFARGLHINFKEQGREPPAIEKAEEKPVKELTDKEINEQLATADSKEKRALAIASIKNERLAELKKKRDDENKALMKRISQITDKKPEESAVSDTVKVETSIDKLYQYIQKYKKVRIDDDLASKLGVKRSQIESWALILEEHSLVELHYPTIGEPEIRSVVAGKR